MNAQIIRDSAGKTIGVFIPINDWEAIVQKHEDLKDIVPAGTLTSNQIKPSQLAGTLSKETAEAMLKYVAESRAEWDERLQRPL